MTRTKRSAPAASAPAPFRLSRMARACVLATGALVAGGAGAQTSAYTNLFPNAYSPPAWSVTGFAFWITTDVGEQFNSGSNRAEVLTPNIGTWQIGGSSSNTISSNSIMATARGNTGTNTHSMGLLVNNGFGDDGLGIAASQSNGSNNSAGSGAQFSTITGMALPGTIFIQLQDTDAAAAQNLSSNSIAASSILNVMDNAITGVGPIGYTSTATGQAQATFLGGGPALLTTGQGGLSINSVQAASNSGPAAGSASQVVDTVVRLDIHHPTAAAVPQTANLTVSNNSISAEFGANRATNEIRADAGSGSFTGAATVVNAQTNFEDPGAVANPDVTFPAQTTTALVSGAGVTADIRSTTAGDPNTLSATLDLTSNGISATSTGNRATNQIRFLSGSAITGSGTVAANVATATGAALTDAAATSDVAVANLQANATTLLVSDVTGTTVSATTDNLATGGVVNVTSNSVSSASTGNTAGNTIAATATTYAATTGVANAQSNDGVTITATNTGTTVSAVTGMTDTTSTGTVNASSNTISSAATGNANASAVTLSPTNSITALPAAGSGSLLTSVSAGAVATGAATAGISINSVQSNTSVNAVGAVTATLTDANVFASSSATTTTQDVADSTFAATGNALSAVAAGNTNTGTATLSGASLNITAAVASTQFNGNDVTGTITSTAGNGTGVTLTMGNVDNTTLSVSSNTMTAAATGSSTANTLSVAANTLTAGPAAYAGNPTGDATVTTGTVNTTAAFSVSSVQHNEGLVTSSNRTRTDFATITAGVEASGLGVTNSTLTVTGNEVSSTTTANSATNSLAIAPGLLATSDGVAAQLGAVVNLQNNAHAGTESSRAGGQGGAGQLIGITYQEAVDAASRLTVTGNAISATSRGNDAANGLTASIGGYTATASATANGNITSADNTNAGTVSVTSDFVVVSNQNDAAAGRTATADNIVISIDDLGGTAVQTMNGQLTLTGNTVGAEARNNNVANTLSLTGSTGNVNTTAGILNQQVSSTPLTATTESQFRLRASGVVNPIGSDAATATALTMTGNQSSAVAVGNSASNALTASGVMVNGNGAIAAGGVSYDSTTTATVADADFGAVNVQTQSGDVTAATTNSVRLNVDGSQVVSTFAATQLTVTGNGVQSLAQANSARTTLDLGGTSVTTSAAIANVQTTTGTGNVTATHTAPTTAGGDVPGFLIMAGDAQGVTGAAMTVTGNSVSVSAGQNAADNWLQSNATTLTGRALGTNTLAYDPLTGSASATTDLAVVNVQQSTIGAVTATATQPGDIGAQIQLMDGGSLAVTGNSVSASGSTNNASNLLVMDRAGAPVTVSVAATGAIVSGQLNAGQTVTATVGDPVVATNIGIRAEPAGPGVTIANTTAPVVNVTGNSVQSSASGNIVTNAATASATGAIALSATGQSLAVLTDQGNNAALNATTQNLAFGVNAAVSGGGETSVTGATVNVTGNTAAAAGSGNTATNTVSAVADIISGGDAAVASIALTNSQVSNVGATVTTLVDTISAGIDASGATGLVDGSTVNVLSNRMQAIGYGNSATNTLTANAATGLSANASAALANTQTSSDVVSSTASNIRAGVMAGDNVIGDTAAPTVVTVSGNVVTAIGGGSNSVNVLNGSAGAILTASAVTPTFSLASTQTNDGANTATATGVTIGAVSGALGSVTGDTTLSVLSNRVQSSAYGNDDSNTMNLSASAGSASMFSGQLTGTQTNTGALTANTNTVDVGYFNNAPAGTVAVTTTLQVSGNVITGTAGANTASNVLNMTAGMASGTPLAPNFALNHTQTNDAAAPVSATVSTVRVGVSVTDAASTVTAAGLNTLSNTIQSSAYANSSSNTMNLAATAGSTTAFTGALNAAQTNDAAVTSGVSTITVGPSIAGTSTDTPMLISGNAVSALGGGNTTANVLNAVSGAAFGTPSAAPMYALANAQSNTGAVSVTAASVNIGAMPSTIASTGSVNFGVLGNSITASGYGNSASNTVGVTTPLWGGAPVASASLTNGQSNTASITASVTSSTIGVGLTTGSGVAATGTHNMIVTGNSITAQAIGNTAVNRITSR